MPPITLDDLNGQLESLEELAAKPAEALDTLPPEEREAGREAQQSVVDARRRAETHEGLLQVN
jgi:hypothetical protein